MGERATFAHGLYERIMLQMKTYAAPAQNFPAVAL